MYVIKMPKYIRAETAKLEKYKTKNKTQGKTLTYTASFVIERKDKSALNVIKFTINIKPTVNKTFITDKIK